MQISYDIDARTTYITVSDAKITRTVDVSPTIAVDVDAVGEAVGVEFLVLPHNVTDDMVHLLADQFPALRILAKADWRPIGV